MATDGRRPHPHKYLHTVQGSTLFTEVTQESQISSAGVHPVECGEHLTVTGGECYAKEQEDW